METREDTDSASADRTEQPFVHELEWPLDSILESSRWVAVLRADAAGVVRRANAAAERLLGATEARLTGRELSELVPLPPGSDGAAPRELELRDASGRVHRALASLHEVRHGQAAAHVCLAVDVTDRRRAVGEPSPAQSRDLALRNRELAALHRISQMALAAESLDEALGPIVDEISAATGFPVVAVELYDPLRRTMTLRAARGLEREPNREVPLEESLGGRVAVSGAPLVERWESARELPARHPLRGAAVGTLVCVPAAADRRVIGTLSLAHPEALELGEHVVPLAASLAGAIAALADRAGVREREERLKAQLLQAQKLEAIGTLAGGVAHDFNNLLTAILGYAYLLKQDARPDDPFHRGIEAIETAAQRAARLTQQLLGFAREGMHLSVPVDLHEIVRDVSALLARTLEERIDVVEVLEAPDATVLGDPSQLHQVLLNLAVNARDAMPDGGRLRFASERVEVDAVPVRAHPNLSPVPHVLLSVADEGLGIAPENLERVLEPFFTTKHPGEGSGMGLSSAYGIVQSHGGALELSSRLGAGTTVRVWLPLSQEKRAEREAQPGAPVRGEGHVLVVDDEELVRNVACELLRSLGYTVRAAEDGIGAIDAYLAAEGEVDLVLLDIVMPRMGGRECLRALKRLDPAARIVLSSGWQQGGSLQDAFEEGALGFLRKPYRLEALSEVVAAAIRKREGAP